MDEDKLIEQNKGLIFLAIKQMHLYWKTQDEYQDFIDAGYDGLLNGIRSYNKEKGIKPSTYYFTCIKHEIGKIIQRKNRKRCTGKVVSLNLQINEMNDELIDIIASDVDIQKEVEDKLLAERIVEIVEELPIEKDIEVIKHTFGLDGYRQISCSELAKQWGVNKNSIIFRKNRALRQLWRMLKEEDIWK